MLRRNGCSLLPCGSLAAKAVPTWLSPLGGHLKSSCIFKIARTDEGRAIAKAPTSNIGGCLIYAIDIKGWSEIAEVRRAHHAQIDGIERVERDGMSIGGL